MDVEVILFKEEIINDIRRDITRVERARNLQDNPILTDDDADRYELCGSIDEALGLAVDNMQAYLAHPSQFAHLIANNHTDDWEERSIQLSMPANWPLNLLDSLKKSVHRYIVKYTEAELMGTALPGDPYTGICMRSAATHYNEITSTLSARIGGIKIHPTIFG